LAQGKAVILEQASIFVEHPLYGVGSPPISGLEVSTMRHEFITLLGHRRHAELARSAYVLQRFVS
jgi:hypothetical protein